ncbi:MAG: phospholipase A-2-activating protein isoform [Gammaproteobacteria bacterium]|nr:phospholipase A-2-activating protein isoform [Gammaproteobacteria bacterium]
MYPSSSSHTHDQPLTEKALADKLSECLSSSGIGNSSAITKILALSSNRVVMAGGYGYVAVANIDEKPLKLNYLSTIRKHLYSVLLTSLSPNRIVTSGDGGVACWDIHQETGQATCIAEWGVPYSEGISQVLGISSNHVLTYGGGGIKCWQIDEDKRSALCISKWEGSIGIPQLLLPNGLVLSINGGITCSKVDESTGHGILLSIWKGHKNPIHTLLALPNGLILAAGGQDISCWKINQETGEGKCLSTKTVAGTAFRQLCVLPNGWIVSFGATYRDDKLIWCWKINESNGELTCLTQWAAHSPQVSSLSVLPNGLIISAGNNPDIKLWRGTHLPPQKVSLVEYIAEDKDGLSVRPGESLETFEQEKGYIKCRNVEGKIGWVPAVCFLSELNPVEIRQIQQKMCEAKLLENSLQKNDITFIRSLLKEEASETKKENSFSEISEPSSEKIDSDLIKDRSSKDTGTTSRKRAGELLSEQGSFKRQRLNTSSDEIRDTNIDTVVPMDF